MGKTSKRKRRHGQQQRQSQASATQAAAATDTVRDTASGSHSRTLPSVWQAAARTAGQTQQLAANASRTQLDNTKPVAPRVPSKYRDALTGAPLVRGRDTRIWRTWDEPDDAETGRIGRDVPTSIDTAQPYAVPLPADTAELLSRRDYLGGLAWTPEAERFFKGVVPKTITDALRVYHEWWTVPYVVEQLRLKVGDEKLGAVLMHKRDRKSIPDVADYYDHTLGWVTRAITQCYRLVRKHYLPQEYLQRIELLAAWLVVDEMTA